MRIISFLLGGAAILCASATDAAVPIISGTYLLKEAKVCGIAADPWPGAVTTSFDGVSKSIVATVAFDHATGKADITGVQGSTQIIVPNSSGGSVSLSPNDGSAIPYSNTATTFTVNGQTYKVIYGTVTGGIAQELEFSGVETSTGLTSANCVDWGHLSLM